MSTDILAALVPKGCEPPKVEPFPPVAEDMSLPLEVLKQRLTGLPVNQYPILLSLLVKGAWAAQAFGEDGKIGEFVTNLEAGLTSALVDGKPEKLVMFALRAPHMLEEFQAELDAGKGLGMCELKFWEVAGELMRLRSALKEFQDVDASGGSESGESQGA